MAFNESDGMEDGLLQSKYQPPTVLLESDDKMLDALKMLPTCERCRRLRRKCDTELPSCRLCKSANVTCEFKDHVTQQLLARTYIQSLLERWGDLKEELLASCSMVDVQPTENSENVAIVQLKSFDNCTSGLQWPAEIVDLEIGKAYGPPPCAPIPADIDNLQQQEFDGLFPVSDSSEIQSFYFGSSSAVVLATEVLLSACPDSSLLDSASTLDKCHQYTSHPSLSADSELTSANLHPSEYIIRFLLDIYKSSINILFPFVSEKSIQEDYEIHISLVRVGSPDGHCHTIYDTFSYFRSTMMCAIACATHLRHKPWLSAYEHLFYTQALSYIDKVTSEVSEKSLQILMLINIYCLFRPHQGNIWKLVGAACRLAVEVGNHCEKYNFLPEQENEDQKTLRRKIFYSLYLVERKIGHLFGRPADMLESIMTTNYIDSSKLNFSSGQDFNQLDTTAHHCRLIYLRSEIFKDLYLPTPTPSFNMGWYQDQYFAIVRWHNEVPVDELADVGTASCHIAFHSSVVFLFQPLVLRALSNIGTHPLPVSNIEALPIDNYNSAVKVLQIYGKILSAPSNSKVANFPLTFMAAHEIYIAGLTVMAYVMLSNNTQMQLLIPLIPETTSFRSPRQNIDRLGAYNASTSCVILLSWCATQWNGCNGMLDIFKEVFASVLSKAH